jgi:hypothetical protein
MKMKQLAIALVGLLVCGASAYSLNRFVLSPEAAVRPELSNICPQHTFPENFHILGTRQWSKRLIVVYKVNCRNEFFDLSPSYGNLLGHQVVVRKGIGWQAVGGGDRIELLPQLPVGEIVQYGTTRKHRERDERPTVVYGEILTPKVAAVEATFDNGKTLRDEGRDGMFAMALPEAVGVREVKVLNADGQLLQRDSNRQPTIYFDNGPYPVALSPEDAVRHGQVECSQPYTPEARVLGDFRILRTIKSSLGAFVLYRVICRDAATSIKQASLYESWVRHKNSVWRTEKIRVPEDDISYKNENKRSVWQLSMTDYSADYLVPPPGDFVAYQLSSIEGHPYGSFISISGRALTSKVVAVEATFSTGQTLHDRVTNGLFMMILPRVAEVCELRIRGVNGQVLQHIDRPPPTSSLTIGKKAQVHPDFTKISECDR